MTLLEKRIANHLCMLARLQNVPIPVLDEAVKQTLAWMEQNLSSDTTIAALSEEWAECDACGELLLHAQVLHDVEGIHLCATCAASASDEAIS